MQYEYVGNVHLHTTFSDGSASPQEIVRTAEMAGLDFLIPTDHNTYLPGLDGWYGKTLLLIGEEIRVRPQGPQGNHYLVFDVYEEMASLARDPQRLMDEVGRRGGFGFIAHPFERAAPRFQQPSLPWREWQAKGYTGISLWNYMSEFKSYLGNVPKALFAAFFPRAVIRGPFSETLAKWDQLLESRPTPIIGTSDAHAETYALGPIRREVFPYSYLFRCVNQHILSGRSFSGRWQEDKDIVYDAMKKGTGFVAYDLLGDARGFRFTAGDARVSAHMGQEITLSNRVKLEVRSPLFADLRIIWKGQVVAHKRGKRLEYIAQERGAYRVEAHRWAALRWRGWVFTNPIYLV